MIVQNPLHDVENPPQITNHYHVQDTHSKLALVTGVLLGFIAGYFTKVMIP